MCPTGMAASVIGGMTICSSLDLYFGNSYKGLSDQKMAIFRSEFEELKLIIIDEMSMVSADDLYKIHHRLTDVFDNNPLFGGISIMFVGDILQLKPLKGKYIFEAPKELGTYCILKKSLFGTVWNQSVLNTIMEKVRDQLGHKH